MKSVGMLLFLTVTVGCLAACTSTSHKIKSEHLDPEWQSGPFKKILVIGVYDDRGYRISSESVFAAELSEKAVAASPSYDLIPDLGALDDEAAVREALVGKDFDAVLTIATIESGEEYDYEAHQAEYGLTRLLGGSGQWSLIGSDLDYIESGMLVLDVGLWDARTLNLVWNATTDSYSMDRASEGVTTLADFMIETLRERGLI